mmetsp:Transcript_98844/g.316890  ORF Transcript_98844/g.316890 Transcript_98844/m.316890 type:complete len:407 (-) Transcript_98844:467-1687(-)
MRMVTAAVDQIVHLLLRLGLENSAPDAAALLLHLHHVDLPFEDDPSLATAFQAAATHKLGELLLVVLNPLLEAPDALILGAPAVLPRVVLCHVLKHLLDLLLVVFRQRQKVVANADSVDLLVHTELLLEQALQPPLRGDVIGHFGQLQSVVLGGMKGAIVRASEPGLIVVEAQRHEHQHHPQEDTHDPVVGGDAELRRERNQLAHQVHRVRGTLPGLHLLQEGVVLRVVWVGPQELRVADGPDDGGDSDQEDLDVEEELQAYAHVLERRVVEEHPDHADEDVAPRLALAEQRGQGRELDGCPQTEDQARVYGLGVASPEVGLLGVQGLPGLLRRHFFRGGQSSNHLPPNFRSRFAAAPSHGRGDNDHQGEEKQNRAESNRDHINTVLVPDHTFCPPALLGAHAHET